MTAPALSAAQSHKRGDLIALFAKHDWHVLSCFLTKKSRQPCIVALLTTKQMREIMSPEWCQEAEPIPTVVIGTRDVPDGAEKGKRRHPDHVRVSLTGASADKVALVYTASVGTPKTEELVRIMHEKSTIARACVEALDLVSVVHGDDSADSDSSSSESESSPRD